MDEVRQMEPALKDCTRLTELIWACGHPVSIAPSTMLPKEGFDLATPLYGNGGGDRNLGDFPSDCPFCGGDHYLICDEGEIRMASMKCTYEVRLSFRSLHSSSASAIPHLLILFLFPIRQASDDSREGGASGQRRQTFTTIPFISRTVIRSFLSFIPTNRLQSGPNFNDAFALIRRRDTVVLAFHPQESCHVLLGQRTLRVDDCTLIGH